MKVNLDPSRKPPHPPREICDSFFKWCFGIVSPSLYYHYALREKRPKSVDLYFSRLSNYRFHQLEAKIKNRTAKRVEYREYCIKKSKIECQGR